MGNPFNVLELRFEEESGFADNYDDVTVNTYGTRIPIQGAPTVQLTQSRIADGSIFNRSTEARPGFNGPRRATLTFQTLFPGNMAATTGAMTENWCYTLLKNGLGAGASGDTGTTIDTGSGTTDDDSINVTAADVQEGSILRVSTPETGARGTASVVTSVASTQYELDFALRTTPDNGDVVYATMATYPPSNVSLDGKSVKFIVSQLGSGNAQHLVGGVLTGLKANFPFGDVPTLDWTFEFAYWETAADGAFGTIALEDDLCAPFDTSGQVIYTSDGTRGAINANSVSIDIDIPTIAEMSTATQGHAGMTITGWTRDRVTVTADIVVQEWVGTYASEFDSDGSGSTFHKFMVQTCTTDGRVVGCYMPKTFMIGNRPTNVDVDGTVGVEFSIQATDDISKTSDLAKSLIRFFQG